MKSIVWLIHLMAPYSRYVLLAVILGTLTITSHIGLMTASAYLLARAALHPPILDLMVTIVGVRFFGISRAVFRYAERYISHDVTFRILSQIRVTFYKGLEPLAPARLLNVQSGDLLSRIVSDVDVQQNLFLRVIMPSIVAIIVLLGYGIFMAVFDSGFVAVLAAGYLLAGLVIPWGIKYLSRGIGKQLVVLKANLNILASDIFFGLTELLAYGQIQNQLDKFKEANQQFVCQQQRLFRRSAAASSLTGMVANLTMWFVLVLGIVLVEQGELGGIYLGMLALGAFSSFEALLPLPLVPYQLEQSRAAADRLLELIDTKPMVVDYSVGLSKPGKMSISFQNVWFRYEPEEPWVLKGVSFEIPEGESLAVVGASGSGKTSIVNLLLRFWEYNEGSIDLGEICLRDFSQEKIIEGIGVVTQRTHIFNATIRENLLLAKPDAEEDELIRAAKKANLHDYILSMPNGYDSYVGEGGYKLSGGQRQRLAIARVLLKDAPILVLDEATSGLDPMTEKVVMEEIYRLMEGRTTLIITHRLTGLDKVQDIVVLDRGKVIERGNHQGLIKRKGVYYKMYNI